MKRMMIAMVLTLSLILGVAALAEQTPTEVPATETPAVQQDATQPAAADTATQQAMQALSDARHAARQEALKAELDGYVAAGTMTQEQADLVLGQFTDRQNAKAQRGQCAGCQGDRGRGGHGSGNRGGKGGRMGGRMGGQMGGQAPAPMN